MGLPKSIIVGQWRDRESHKCSHLRECPVVPEVTFVGEAITDIAKLALLNILFDWVQCIVLRYLEESYQHQCLGERSGCMRLFSRMVTHLHLGISPSWNLHDHVENSLLLIGIQRDIMKWGQRCSILFDVDAVLKCVGCPILSDRVSGGGIGMIALVADGE